MKNELLKNGGWTFQGSRTDIVFSGEHLGVRYQVTRETDQTGPHSGPVQFGQRYAGHTLRTDSGIRESCQIKSRASKAEMQSEAESMIKHYATWEDRTIPLSMWAARQEWAEKHPACSE